MDNPVDRQHRGLSVDRWRTFTVSEQMANIGSEVFRSLKWRDKENEELAQRAFVRALELVDLSLDAAETPSQIREFARLRELLVDYFLFSNCYGSSKDIWLSYFYHFNYAARNVKPTDDTPVPSRPGR